MTSYAGDQTARQREADRKDAQARKQRGRGAHRADTKVIDPKEARTYVPKHHVADFTPSTMDALNAWLVAEQARAEIEKFPAPIGITVFQFRWFIEKGICTAPYEAKPAEVRVPLSFNPVRLVITSNTGLVETEIDVTAKGFLTPKGNAPSLPIYSISVLIAPLFCIRFKWDNVNGRMLVA